MAVGVGQRCVVRVKIEDVELRNARDIVATVESPQYVAHCQEVSFDEVSGLVYVVVDVNSAGPYFMWLEVRFAKEVVYTPAFVFAEVEGEAAPCDAPYIVDVEVAGESVTVTPPKVDVDGGGGASITVDTVLSEASNNAIANSAVTRELKNKVGATEVSSTEPTADFPQVLHTAQCLTEEQKGVARRNIYAMANTPSGDPMHSWYESLGAVWNATTGYWEFLGVNDMTNEDMLEEAILGNSRIYPTANLMSYTATARVMFGQKNMLLDASWSAVKADSLVTNNRYVEVIEFTTQTGAVWVSGFTWACAYCVKLREIRNILNVSLANIYNAFDGCVSLEEVKLQGLPKDVSFADSPLSVESATYTIANADESASFTITFRADRQAIFEANSDFITAKSAKPNITILYQ